jgi:hypothetical protein
MHGEFGDGVLQTICLGWLRTAILLISASWVARITGVSHRCPALFPLLFCILSHCAYLYNNTTPWLL